MKSIFFSVFFFLIHGCFVFWFICHFFISGFNVFWGFVNGGYVNFRNVNFLLVSTRGIYSFNNCFLDIRSWCIYFLCVFGRFETTWNVNCFLETRWNINGRGEPRPLIL